MKQARLVLASFFTAIGIVGFVIEAAAATVRWGWHVWVLFIPLAVFTLGAIMLDEHS